MQDGFRNGFSNFSTNHSPQNTMRMNYVLCAVAILWSLMLGAQTVQNPVDESLSVLEGLLSDFDKAPPERKAVIALRFADLSKKILYSPYDASEGSKLNSEKALKMLINGLILLQSAEIPGFDFSELPKTKVPPPAGTYLDSGADPSVIKDEAVRKEYIQAIVALKAKNEIYNNQFLLGLRRNELVARVQVFIENHSRSPDLPTYLGIVNGAKLPKELKQILLVKAVESP